jgi:hypothetical protein
MTYTIKEGAHYCSGASVGGLHTGMRYMGRNVRFHVDCLYALDNPNCTDDLNKLFGFSYGYHHSNSVRIGWRCKDGQIALFAYCYRNGRVTTKFLKYVKPLNHYACTIYVGDGYVRFNINDKEVYVTLQYAPCAGYLLYPYFGGDCPASQDMNIDLNII